MSHLESTASAQSRAAAHAKLRKLIYREPAVRALVAENARLAAEAADLRKRLAEIVAKPPVPEEAPSDAPHPEAGEDAPQAESPAAPGKPAAPAAKKR